MTSMFSFFNSRTMPWMRDPSCRRRRPPGRRGRRRTPRPPWRGRQGADHLLDGDEAVVDLGHLLFEQAGEELRAVRDRMIRGLLLRMSTSATTARTASPCGRSRRDLLVAGHDQLVVVVVDEQDFPLPDLVHLGGDDLADAVLVLAVQASFSSSITLPARFWRMDSTLRRPKSASLISSETSSRPRSRPRS